MELNVENVMGNVLLMKIYKCQFRGYKGIRSLRMCLDWVTIR
jgi:hypothetical protein